MPRYREPYTLLRRKTNSGKYVYYYRTYDENGKRTTARSTGQTSRGKASQYCQDLISKGVLIPSKEITFSAFVNSWHWWEWGKCHYTLSKNALAPPGKPAISVNTINTNSGYFRNHIEEYFSEKKLGEITPRIIENWQLELLKKLSSSSAKKVSSILKIMLEEAFREGLIHSNPYDRVRRVQASSIETGILTPNEAADFLNFSNLDSYWKGDQIQYALNLVSAFTGMRKGEILALRPPVYHGSWIEVKNSWTRGTGLGPVKTKEERNIPIPQRVTKVLSSILPADPESFIFSSDGGKMPVHTSDVNRAFNAALKRARIDTEGRNIKFHSWRHWLNTQARLKGVPDSMVQAVTGHKTLAMTEHYTHFDPMQMPEIVNLQASLLEA